MIFKKILGASVALYLAAAPAFAGNSSDDALLGAYDAYRAGDPIKFAKHAQKLKSHLLEPWLEYWRLSLRLEDMPPAEVRAFLSKFERSYVAEMLREEWLKVLGKRGEWQEFDRQAAFYSRDDLEVRCYGWASRLERGDESAYAEAAAMWLEPRELPDGCAKVADAMVEEGQLTVGDVWRRVRVLFENGQITAAKTALGYLPKEEAPDERMLAEAARQPKRLLSRLPKNLERRATREVVVLAVVRVARVDEDAAAAALDGPLASRLPEDDLKYLWGRVGHEGAREHYDKALAWYARAGDLRLTDEQLAWKARAALRRVNWQVVRDSIDQMSAGARQERAWSYWYGRALAAQGEETGSRAYYLRVAGRPDFYGLLADEELGYMVALPDKYVPGEDEVAAAKRDPGIARALELIRLGLRTEGVHEWAHSIRFFDDTRLIAAAEVAQRAQIYDRVIETANKTVRVHNFSLRYPVPYQDVFREYAKTHGVDPALVLALVRQESRFLQESRSSAGATGLMQLMPRTARYVAAKLGLRNYRPHHVTEVQTNVGLGTGYLKLVLDQVGHPILASTAYNAGPARARRWCDSRPLEGAVYVETIPFSETRDYVKNVMANSVFYAAMLENKLSPIKARLGIVPPRTGAEPPVEDELP
jgi:soluble lytic murein transglycosylase